MTRMRDQYPFKKKRGNKNMALSVRPHPSKVLGEELRRAQKAKGHSEAEAARLMNMRWGTYVRLVHGVCDFRHHLLVVADYLDTPINTLRGRLGVTEDEALILREKMQDSLMAYRKMTEVGARRRSVNAKALQRMKAEEGWNYHVQ